MLLCNTEAITAPLGLSIFSIYKEGVSYLPFRDVVNMHLTLNANCTLICEELIFNINGIPSPPFHIFFFFGSYEVLQHKRAQVKECEGDALCHVHTQ